MNPNVSMGPSGYSAQKAPSGYNLTKLGNFTPDQMQLFQSLLGSLGQGSSQGLGQLSKLAGGDEQAFSQMEEPAFRNFNKLLGQTASRFSQFGGRDSSAFENAIAGQGSELAGDLQSQRSNIQMQAIRDLLNQSNSLLGQRPYENVLSEKKRGTNFGDILGQVLPSLLKLL